MSTHLITCHNLVTSFLVQQCLAISMACTLQHVREHTDDNDIIDHMSVLIKQ